MNLTKQFFKYVSQNIFGLIGTSCYILADTYFIAQAAGTDGVTLLNLCLPMYNLIFAFGSMIGLGAATRYAILQAQGEARAQRYFSNAILCACLIAIPFMLAGAFCPGTLLQLMGGDGDIVALGLNYTRIFLLFTPFFMCNYIFSAFVRNDGDPSLAMVATLSGSLFNVVFDYIFIFPMGLGLPGAALATAISPVLSIAICSRHFFQKSNTLTFVRQAPSARLLVQSCQLGISGFVGELSSAVTTTVFNFLLLRLAGNVGVAAYGVVANFALVATAIFNGVAQGAQPLISQCYGKNEIAGAKKLLLLGCGTALALAAVVRCRVWLYRYLCCPLQQRKFCADGRICPQRYAHLLPGLLLCRLQYCCGRLPGCGQPPHRGHHHLGQPGRGRHRHLLADPERPVRHERCVVGFPRRRGHHAGPDGVPAQAPAVCVRLNASTEKSRVLPRLLNILNIQCLLPLAFRRAEGPRCLTGQGPPLCGGLAGLFFEHPAQVVGP